MKRIKYLKSIGEYFSIKVTQYAIEVSIISAFVHLVFEILNLYLESKTSKTSFQDYMAACYNARQRWIPQQDDLSGVAHHSELDDGT